MTVRRPWRATTSQVTVNNTKYVSNILRLNDLGQIPTLMNGSLLTGITASKLVGKNYNYITNNTTNIDVELDCFYYIPRANTKTSLGGNTVNLNVPYTFTKIVTGSKFGFEYIPTAGAQNGGQYTLTTPTNAVITTAGWTSFTMIVDGQSYSDGAVFTSKQGANPSRHMIAYVNGTNLFWLSFNHSINKLADQELNFNIFDRNPIKTNRHYVLSGSRSTGPAFSAGVARASLTGTSANQGLRNVAGNIENTLTGWATQHDGKVLYNWVAGGVAPNMNMYWNTMSDSPNFQTAQIQGYRQFMYFVGQPSSVNVSYPSGLTYLQPAVAEVPEGAYFCFHALQNYGAAGSTSAYVTAVGSLGRNSTNVFRWSNLGTAVTTLGCNAGTCTTIVTEGTAWYAFRIENN